MCFCLSFTGKKSSSRTPYSHRNNDPRGLFIKKEQRAVYMMTHIEQEKKTVRQMIEIYCHGKMHTPSTNSGTGKGLCEECSTLLDYAYTRLDHCKFGEKKPTCKKCPIHCYKPDMKKKMREAMRYAGPRMMWYHPIAAIRHLIREL